MVAGSSVLWDIFGYKRVGRDMFLGQNNILHDRQYINTNIQMIYNYTGGDSYLFFSTNRTYKR